jgi:hypothetical protein
MYIHRISQYFYVGAVKKRNKRKNLSFSIVLFILGASVRILV